MAFVLTIQYTNCGLSQKKAGVRYLCIDTAVTKRPRATVAFTHGAHDGGVGLTDLFTETKQGNKHS